MFQYKYMQPTFLIILYLYLFIHLFIYLCHGLSISYMSYMSTFCSVELHLVREDVRLDGPVLRHVPQEVDGEALDPLVLPSGDGQLAVLGGVHGGTPKIVAFFQGKSD